MFYLSQPITGLLLKTSQLFLVRVMQSLAEKEGFEPSWRIKRQTVFETVPFNHSGISPCKDAKIKTPANHKMLREFQIKYC